MRNTRKKHIVATLLCINYLISSHIAQNAPVYQSLMRRRFLVTKVAPMLWQTAQFTYYMLAPEGSKELQRLALANSTRIIPVLSKDFSNQGY